MMLRKLLINYPYFAAVILFAIGTVIVLTRSNVIKKLIGINIIESAVFLMFVAAGNIRGGVPPILDQTRPGGVYVNPLPSALMLTGIVVSVSVSALALALVFRLYGAYGTLDARRIAEMRSEVRDR